MHHSNEILKTNLCYLPNTVRPSGFQENVFKPQFIIKGEFMLILLTLKALFSLYLKKKKICQTNLQSAWVFLRLSEISQACFKAVYPLNSQLPDGL